MRLRACRPVVPVPEASERINVNIGARMHRARSADSSQMRILLLTHAFNSLTQRLAAELQQRGQVVGMVGDGVNDAPALTRADVGLAIGAGTDVAIESAGIVLASSDPRSVVKTIRLSRATYRKMVQNLWWAAGYNIVAIPLAAGAFAWAGIDLSPAVGAILMSMSTIVVALNAQLLRRVQLRPSEAESAGGG